MWENEQGRLQKKFFLLSVKILNAGSKISKRNNMHIAKITSQSALVDNHIAAMLSK